jgi:hypothetical protein
VTAIGVVSRHAATLRTAIIPPAKHTSGRLI